MPPDHALVGLPAGRLEQTTHVMVRLALEHALRQTPRRLAHWRIRTLDRLLRQVEELRLQGERKLPDDLRKDLLAFAARHDPWLLSSLTGNSHGLNTVHDALFEAQGRVMMSVAALRSLPNWLEVDQEADPTADLLESQAA